MGKVVQVVDDLQGAVNDDGKLFSNSSVGADSGTVFRDLGTQASANVATGGGVTVGPGATLVIDESGQNIAISPEEQALFTSIVDFASKSVQEDRKNFNQQVSSLFEAQNKSRKEELGLAADFVDGATDIVSKVSSSLQSGLEKTTDFLRDSLDTVVTKAKPAIVTTQGQTLSDPASKAVQGDLTKTIVVGLTVAFLSSILFKR